MADATLAGQARVANEPALRPQLGRTRRMLRVARRYPQLAIGLAIVGAFVLAGVLAPLLAPHDPNAQDLYARLQGPVWETGDSTYLLGADSLGRDTLSRLLYGARVSLIVGFFSVVISGIFGSIVGLISGYVGGNLDAFLMRIVDIQLAFPYLLIAIVIGAFWGTGLFAVIIALSVSGWMGFARTVRSLVLGLKDAQYVTAAHSIGSSNGRVMFRHLLPNTFGPLVIYTTFQVPARILAEATLSFLGLGIQPPDPSWGNMLAQNRGFITAHPWMVILPGLSLSIIALGANLLGDGLRDYLDPRMRRR